jgi:hypothetical protein
VVYIIGLASTLLIEDGHFSLSADRSPLEKGRNTIDSDKINFSTDEFDRVAERVCGKFPTYTYQWAFDSETQKLIFTVVDDVCAPRQIDFTLITRYLVRSRS